MMELRKGVLYDLIAAAHESQASRFSCVLFESLANPPKGFSILGLARTTLLSRLPILIKKKKKQLDGS